MDLDFELAYEVAVQAARRVDRARDEMRSAQLHLTVARQRLRDAAGLSDEAGTYIEP